VWNKIVITLSLLIGIYLYFNAKPHEQITFFDVGQGDSALIEIGELKVLVDTGFDMRSIWAIDRYISLNDRKIDIVILTHPHFDHYGEIYHVLSRYRVGEIWIVKGCKYPYLEGLAIEYDVDVVNVYVGMIWRFEGIKMEVLSPNYDANTFGCQDLNKLNNESIVMRLTYNGNSIRCFKSWSSLFKYFFYI